tara:strand:- start:850 stop:1038 length:189 start_codon:yes stop_codon:yes gene_type:complete
MKNLLLMIDVLFYSLSSIDAFTKVTKHLVMEGKVSTNNYEKGFAVIQKGNLDTDTIYGNMTG